MRNLRKFRIGTLSGAAAAVLLGFAAPLSAQTQPAQTQLAQTRIAPQLAQSGPVAFSGLDCARCGPGSFCVVNPLRFEYACAPQGTFACAGFQRTAYCPLGTTCWDGICR